MNVMKRTLLICGLGLSIPAVHAQETEVRYLSGTDAAHTVDWDFKVSDGRRSGVWTRIAVPSCWEQQGFGSYNYGRDYKTDGKNSRFADEKGSYRHRFKVPAQWKGRVISIVFEGSMTDTEVRINGKSAGPVHRGAFYRFRHDISELLKYGGDNLLEVEVSKMSSDPSVNNAERLADYWIFGGIFRPVWLEASPTAHIAGLAVDATHDGKLTIEADLRGSLKVARLAWELTDPAGKVMIRKQVPVRPMDSLQRIEAIVPDVKPWTSETPALYLLRVSLQDAAGRTVHSVRERIGFRTVEIRRGQGVFVNGIQVKFKGVNRHCFWPETARTLSREQQEMDLRLLKEMNMNAVRCSHYPPDKYFLELCDSLGIFVINELAGWQKAYSTNAGTPLVREM
ncbi:MAG: glycoside hydrolase family 2 protein, partial [Bacteroidota bacterium]